MSVVELPNTLARTIEVGKALGDRPGYLAFDTDSGATTRNKLPGSPLADVVWSVICDEETKQQWRAFYRYDCRGGADAIGYRGEIYNWVGGPQFKEVTGLMHRGAIALEME